MMISKSSFFSLFLGLIVSTANAAEIETNTAQMQAMDKITGRVSLIDVPINSEVRFGSFSIVVRNCKTRPPEEMPENFAFVDLVDETKERGNINIFKGWMLSSSPALNAVEHPIYDVWLIKCTNTELANVKNLTANELKERDNIPMLGVEKKLPIENNRQPIVNTFEENISGEPIDLLPPMVLEEAEDISGQEQVIKIDGSEIVREESVEQIKLEEKIIPADEPVEEEVVKSPTNVENTPVIKPEEPQNLIPNEQKFGNAENVVSENTPVIKPEEPQILIPNEQKFENAENVVSENIEPQKVNTPETTEPMSITIEDLEKELSIEAINN